MSEAEGMCGDNRFEIITAAKAKLLNETNIESSPEEMKVIDQFLFRCWQMGWLKSVEQELQNKTKFDSAINNENKIDELHHALEIAGVALTEIWRCFQLGELQNVSKHQELVMNALNAVYATIEPNVITDPTSPKFEWSKPTSEPQQTGASPKEESALVKYAQSELKRLEDACKTDDARKMQRMVNSHILDLIAVFGAQGHSDFSGSYALSNFKRIADWKPLTPLTGEDDEWMEIGDNGKGGVVEQNKRYSALFRENHDNSTAHDVDDIIFSDNGGITWFTNQSKAQKYRKPIEFPWMPPNEPRKVYIKYTKEVPMGEICDEFVDITNNEEEQEKLRARFRKEMEHHHAD